MPPVMTTLIITSLLLGLVVIILVTSKPSIKDRLTVRERMIIVIAVAFIFLFDALENPIENPSHYAEYIPLFLLCTVFSGHICGVRRHEKREI